MTDLITAAGAGDVQAVQALLDTHAEDVNHANALSVTPLYAAAEHGTPEVVTLLLAAGAIPGQASVFGMSPLHIAARWGHSEVVAQLLAAGAAVDATVDDPAVAKFIRNAQGATSLWFAARHHHPSVIAQLLIAGAEVDHATQLGSTPLHVTSGSGDDGAVVRQLLHAGADVNLTCGEMDGCTSPLYVAAQNGNYEVVALLLAAGATVNLASALGITPLHAAALHSTDMLGDPAKTISMLLDAGADVNPT